MIETIFATMLIIGIVFQLASIYWESWILSILCIIWFLKLMLDALNIEQLVVYQPVVVNNTLVNGSYTFSSHSDFGLNTIFLLFVFMNVVLAIYFRSGSTFTRKYKI